MIDLNTFNPDEGNTFDEGDLGVLIRFRLLAWRSKFGKHKDKFIKDK